MAFKTWQTGIHIQQDKVLIVALTRSKQAWRLRRWWDVPLEEGTVQDGIIVKPGRLAAALQRWRKTLPHQHLAFAAFPAARTLQKTLPRPALALRDSELACWVGAALSRELETPADTLCFDYTQDTFSPTFHVTAAQSKEIDTLLSVAKALDLRLAAITPDAGALANYLPLLEPAQCVAWRDGEQWLWAMRHQWGRRYRSEAANGAELAALLALTEQEIVLFDARRNPWDTLTHSHPPLPAHGADFTVALALAMSKARI